MVLAVQCSRKNLGRTAIAAAATACMVDICLLDVEKRQAIPGVLSRHPKIAAIAKYVDPPLEEGFVIPREYRELFVCPNEAILRFVADKNYYAYTPGELHSAYCIRTIPRIRALMTNERILCNYISSIKFHIEFADDDPPPFFDHVAFRHLMYQYFKPSICQGNFLSNLKTATDDELLGDILRSAYPRPVQNRSKETRNRLGKSAWQIALVAQKMPEAPTTERSPTYGYVVKALEEILEPLHSDESLRIWVKESIDSDEVTACSSQVSNHIQRMQGTIYKVLRLCRILYPAKLKRMLEYLNSLTVERTTKDSAMEGITKIDEDIFLGSL